MKLSQPYMILWAMITMCICACQSPETGNAPSETAANNQRPPNLIFIFCDDLGYGDIGPFGSTKHRTPNLDKMAEQGRKFTHFYVSSSVCTPSRSSLMTGCYPTRVDMDRNAIPPGNSVMRQVLFPLAHKGLNPKEVTLAEVLKGAGYATACIGKWHLGDQEAFLPTKQGFDYNYGIPYSNDMGDEQFEENPPLPLLLQEEVIEAPVNQNTITERYGRETVKFIEAHKDEPFFIYLPHAMPHNPVHAGERFQGKSANNGYGDAVEEIDWTVGLILDKLDELGLAENTLVVFSSDNGASPAWGGSNAPLRGGKATIWEGGFRVPCLMQWKGKIPKGTVCEELTTTMDFVPTMATLTGQESLLVNPIDGKNIFPLLVGESGAKSEYDALYYYYLEQLQAIRKGDWKCYLPLEKAYIHLWRPKLVEQPLQLYNLREDVAEENNVAEEHPEIVEEMLQLAHAARLELGDMGMTGSGTRPAATIPNPTPRIMESVQ